MGPFLIQLREMIAGLSMGRKITMLLIVGLAVGVISYVVHLSKLSSMEPLYTNLNAQDMGSILTTLDKQGVHYDVDQEKRTIMVPSTQVLDIRLKLAGEGLPRFGGVGFELFDKSGFGMSDFEQKINYQRALEGELSRTIAGIQEVESCRVHLVLPEKSLFSESTQTASASVILKLGGAPTLSQSKVNAITHLVSSSVEGLGSEHVTVVDTAGHLLTSGTGDSSVAASSEAFDQKTQIERSYEKRIVDLLTPVVGLGKVIAHVTATVDFTKTDSTEEIVDPSKVAVVSESRTTAKKTDNGTGVGGIVGATGNQVGGPGSASTSGGGSSDEGSEQIAYQVSKTVRRQTSPMGAIKNLSVAILVDGAYTDKGGKKTYAPRSADELKKFEDLTKSAIGFSVDRGDQIKVDNLAFQNPETEIAASDAWYKKKTTNGLIATVGANAVVVIVAILVLLLVVRPMVKSWNGSRSGAAGGVMIGADGMPILGTGTGNGMPALDVKNMVQSNPVAAATAIREWLK